MNIEFHPAVERDVDNALQPYDAVSKKLGDEFKEELRRMISLAANNPGKFHFIKPGVRRVNFLRFPYHFLYREIAGGIRVTLVRHHRRHPDFETKRQ